MYKIYIYTRKRRAHSRIQKLLASRMVKVLSPFDFQKVGYNKASGTLTQSLYGCISWEGVKQLN